MRRRITSGGRGPPQGRPSSGKAPQRTRPLQLAGARVKRWGKSPPPRRKRRGHGKPRRKQGRIGAAGAESSDLRARADPQPSRPGGPREASSDRRPRGLAVAATSVAGTEPGLQAFRSETFPLRRAAAKSAGRRLGAEPRSGRSAFRRGIFIQHTPQIRTLSAKRPSPEMAHFDHLRPNRGSSALGGLRVRRRAAASFRGAARCDSADVPYSSQAFCEYSPDLLKHPPRTSGRKEGDRQFPDGVFLQESV